MFFLIPESGAAGGFRNVNCAVDLAFLGFAWGIEQEWGILEDFSKISMEWFANMSLNNLFQVLVGFFKFKL